jgi:hypothetical protein
VIFALLRFIGHKPFNVVYSFMLYSVCKPLLLLEFPFPCTT